MKQWKGYYRKPSLHVYNDGHKLKLMKLKKMSGFALIEKLWPCVCVWLSLQPNIELCGKLSGYSVWFLILGEEM